MTDVNEQIGAVSRAVAGREVEGRLARVVVLEQTYPTGIDDLWDAVTNVDRIPRWFAPVSGELRLGGTYQVEGNASGTITACDPPRSFDATWEYGDGVSWIEVRLTAVDGSHTRLSLSHLAHPEEHWDTYGPGATGIGWDMGFAGLFLHVATGAAPAAEAEEWATSPDGVEFATRSGRAWEAADIAGGADPEAAHASAARTIAFYTGAEPPAS